MNQQDKIGRLFLSILRFSAVLLCLMLVLGFLGRLYLSRFFGIKPPSTQEHDKIINNISPTPENGDQASLSLEESLQSEPAGDVQLSTIETLEQTIVSQNDPYYQAEKYRNLETAPVFLMEPPVSFATGDSRDFWVLNVNTNDYRSIDAALIYKTDHVYFWVEDGIEFNYQDIARLADAFETQIYPKNRSIFGQEYSPGVDNNKHLTILYADDLGGAAGYFSAADSYTRDVDKFSNRAEMFYLSAEHISLSDEYAYGVMAHEFQHMIHWNIDRDEQAWINEGLSELAVDLNGYDLGGFTYLFNLDPDLQLNFWPGIEQGSSTPHYGASYLFMKYLHQRFGDTFIQDLVSEPENGFDGIEMVLQKNRMLAGDGELVAERLFQDWTMANYLNAEGLDAGEGSYREPVLFLPIKTKKEVKCGEDPVSGSVNQFGADYFEISCDEEFAVTVEWDETVSVLPVDPHSGKWYFWSNRGDESAMRLSRKFDLRGVESPITLSFWTWYDIESDYDYVYVNVSENGIEWKNLETSSCTKQDPTGANYGCGYNGRSMRWIKEVVDLSDFAGKQITIEFEYITDAAVNGEGFVVDDIAIEALSYRETFEYGNHGWDADGFVRIENALPQLIGLTFFRDEAVDAREKLIQDTPSKITLPVQYSKVDNGGVLIISGLTQHTHHPANYRLAVQPAP